MIRNVQPFLPHAATTNRALAKACFLISGANYMCRYHQFKSKHQGTLDGENELPGQPKVTGVAYPRICASGISPVDGYWNCGCSEDDVLLDFIFWKTWSITSPVTQVSEGWLDQTLEPRSRAFCTTAFKAMHHLTLDEMYTGDRDYALHRQIQLTLMIQRMTAELGHLTAQMDGVVEGEE
jgi:hypothetical protein